jgi:hypothetical protein
VRSSRRLRPRERAVLLAALTLATIGLAVAPPPLGSPIRRLANYRADTADPIWNAPDMDGSALRRGGRILPDSRRATYFLEAPPEPQLGHDLIGGSLLFFLPGRPVPSLADAAWVLDYRSGRPRPAGRVYRLGPGIDLIRLRNR